MQRTAFATLAMTLVLAGCQTAPNTPGAGYGEQYTPIIDTKGVDFTRYSADLGECRQFAGIVDRQNQAMAGALGGALIVGIASALLGGNSYQNQQSAMVGGFAGLSGAEARAAGQQQRVMINCMAGRGYRTLDGSVMANPNPPGGSPYMQAAVAASPATPAQPQQAGLATPSTSTSSVPGVTGNSTTAEPMAAACGTLPCRDLYVAEKTARAEACSTSPRMSLAGTGPGFEQYHVTCTNGERWTYQCEFGNCRRSF